MAADPIRLVEAAQRDSLLVAAVNHGTPADREWTREALCRPGGPNDDVWYPRTYGQDTVRAAVRICRGCPVRVQCLASVLNEADHHDHGVAAGTTPRQRARMRAALRVGLKAAA